MGNAVNAMDANTIKELLRHREGATLEVKKAQGGLPGNLWETYSSFANTDGGLILLGVEERRDGSLAAGGVRDPQQMVKDIWNCVNNKQKVSVNLLRDRDVAVVPIGEAQVVAVNVPRAERTLRPVYVGPNPMSGSFRPTAMATTDAPPRRSGPCSATQASRAWTKRC